MNVYIMRHGETDWNKKGLVQGATDVPLNEYGIELAQKTRDGLKADHIVFDKIFSSPYQRALKTAQIIAEEYKMDIVVDERIREMCYGECEGVKVMELRTNPRYKECNKCFTDPVHYLASGDGESYEELFSRINAFLTEQILPLEGTCNHVLVVCHGAVSRAFISLIQKMPLSEYWNIHQPNCCINIAHIEGGRMQIIETNRLYYKQIIDAERGFV